MIDYKAQFQGNERKVGLVVSKAWQDPAFKARLQKNPTAVLNEFGFDIPPGVTVSFHETTATEMFLSIPAAPGRALGDELLVQVSRGSTTSTAGTASTASCPAGTAATLNTAGTAR